jgi:hypothetical protein
MMEKLPIKHGERFFVGAFRYHHQSVLSQVHGLFSAYEQFTSNTSDAASVSLAFSSPEIFAYEDVSIESKFSFRRVLVNILKIFQYT